MPVQEYIISLSLKKFGSLKNNFISDYEKKNRNILPASRNHD